MMVFQCLMVVIESGWQMVRIASPILVALFRATRFSSSFFINSLKRSKWRIVVIWNNFSKQKLSMPHTVCFNIGARQSHFNKMKSEKYVQYCIFGMEDDRASSCRHVAITELTVKTCQHALFIYLNNQSCQNIKLNYKQYVLLQVKEHKYLHCSPCVVQ